MEYFLRLLTATRSIRSSARSSASKKLLSVLFVITIPCAVLLATPSDVEDNKHSDEKLDVIHHVTDGNTLELEPFGEIHLPTIKIGDFDISITRHVVMMWIASLVLLVLFVSIGNTYKKMKPTEAPKGIANLIEVIVDFVRIDIVKANIGHGYGLLFHLDVQSSRTHSIRGDSDKQYLRYLYACGFYVHHYSVHNV